MAIGTIVEHEVLQGDYRRIRFLEPAIAAKAAAGQFVHVRIGNALDAVLRRPFSIHDASPEDGIVTVVYKIVGKGTARLAEMEVGDRCDLLGPLGHGYTPPVRGVHPVYVTGGYGVAATFLLAKKFGGTLLAGARGAGDILLTDEYRAAGCGVKVATEDGSMGIRGRVTALLDLLLEEHAGEPLFFYGCGPHPMLMALTDLLRARGLDGEMSLDHLMCCGVGACFACVVKVKADNEDGWRYARSCAEGPVFPLAMIDTGK